MRSTRWTAVECYPGPLSSRFYYKTQSNDDLQSLLDDKAARTLAHEYMRVGVGRELSKVMDVGIRVNPALARAHGQEYRDPSETIPSILRKRPNDAQLLVFGSPIKTWIAAKRKLVLVGIVLE